MYRPAVMPELKGADRDPLDGAAGITDGDVLADAEGVLGEKEQARDDVLDKGLRPESERDADHSRASEQWRDVDPERGEAHERRDRINRATMLQCILTPEGRSPGASGASRHDAEPAIDISGCSGQPSRKRRCQVSGR